MGINWFSKADKNSYATIYKTNITINKVASKFIDDAYKCQLGIDDENKIIYIKPISKQEADLGCINQDDLFNLSISKSYCRISSTDFVKVISNITDKDYSFENIKYECKYLKEENLLQIDLKKEAK